MAESGERDLKAQFFEDYLSLLRVDSKIGSLVRHKRNIRMSQYATVDVAAASSPRKPKGVTQSQRGSMSE